MPSFCARVSSRASPCSLSSIVLQSKRPGSPNEAFRVQAHREVQGEHCGGRGDKAAPDGLLLLLLDHLSPGPAWQFNAQGAHEMILATARIMTRGPHRSGEGEARRAWSPGAQAFLERSGPSGGRADRDTSTRMEMGEGLCRLRNERNPQTQLHPIKPSKPSDVAPNCEWHVTRSWLLRMISRREGKEASATCIAAAKSVGFLLRSPKMDDVPPVLDDEAAGGLAAAAPALPVGRDDVVPPPPPILLLLLLLLPTVILDTTVGLNNIIIINNKYF